MAIDKHLLIATHRLETAAAGEFSDQFGLDQRNRYLVEHGLSDRVDPVTKHAQGRLSRDTDEQGAWRLLWFRLMSRAIPFEPRIGNRGRSVAAGNSISSGERFPGSP